MCQTPQQQLPASVRRHLPLRRPATPLLRQPRISTLHRHFHSSPRVFKTKLIQVPVAVLRLIPRLCCASRVKTTQFQPITPLGPCLRLIWILLQTPKMFPEPSPRLPRLIHKTLVLMSACPTPFLAWPAVQRLACHLRCASLLVPHGTG